MKLDLIRSTLTALAGAALVGPLLLAPAAQAAPRTHHFGGEVVADPYGNVKVGARISASLTFDDAATDILADPDIGLYASNGPVFRIGATIAGFDYAAEGLVTTIVLPGDEDYVLITADGFYSLSVVFGEASGQALVEDQLPLSFASFGLRQLKVTGPEVEFLIALDPAAPGAELPSPSTALLIAPLLLGLARRTSLTSKE